MYVIIRLEVRGPDFPTLGKLEKLVREVGKNFPI